MAHLVVNHAVGPPDRVPLARLRTTIGRSARSDVCIPDAFASRLHAEVRQEGDRFWLQDLGSANGTFAKINGSVPVSNGDLLLVGEQILRVDPV